MLLEVRGTGIPAADAASTMLLINSIPMPILAMDDTQIQVQAPFTLVTPDDAQIVIVHQGNIAATITVHYRSGGSGALWIGHTSGRGGCLVRRCLSTEPDWG